MGRPVVVVTHHVLEGWPREDAPFTFATDGIESAIDQAKALAGDKVAGVNSGTLARHCLNAGLLDEIYVDLVRSCSAPALSSSTNLRTLQWSLRDRYR